MKAAPRICFCKVCQEDYRSCSLFTEYDITIKNLQQICLRSSTLNRIGVELVEYEPAHYEPAANVLLKDVVSLAAENGSIYVLKKILDVSLCFADLLLESIGYWYTLFGCHLLRVYCFDYYFLLNIGIFKSQIFSRKSFSV